MAKILVIGGGAMGSAFTIPCLENKNIVTITEPYSKKFINNLKSKKKFHSGLKIKLPKKLKFRKFSKELLKEKFQLHIITNGFQNSQIPKLEGSLLKPYFKQLITSDCGYHKPDSRIFTYALKQAGCVPLEALMIGDKLEADICGAQKMQIDQIFFNPRKEKHTFVQNPTFEINCLSEIPDLLI